MEWYSVGLGLLGLLMFFIAIGLPIPFALAAASLPFLWTIQDFETSLVSSELNLWGVWVNYILLAVPLFVLLGELIARSEIGPRLYQAIHRGVRVHGSAAYGSIGACAGFGAVCGSSMVGSLTIGGVALPEMLKLGYGKRLSAGTLAAGGTLSVLIPPSLILLFYGIVTDVSIGELFIAGIIPGLLLTSAFVAVVLLWGRLDAKSIPRLEESDRATVGYLLLALLPVLVIGLVITVAIYMGIATPTEAAAVACVLTIVIAFWFGGLTLRGFLDSLKSTMRTMGYLGLLLSAAALFGFVFNYHRVPQQFTEAFLALELSPFLILAFVIVFYVIVGMFLEPVSMTFITLPTLYPLIQGAGYDLIWFGIVYTITMEIAVLTPPVGLNLYVIQGLAPKQVRIQDVIMGVLPFIGALVCLIVLLLSFPEIATWLPDLMGGGR
jgi:tripartite ATP-independent transporter DctM subunit